MSTYRDNINIIRKGVYGRDVRKAIADCLEGTSIGIPEYLAENDVIMDQIMLKAATAMAGSGMIAFEHLVDHDYRMIFYSSDTNVNSGQMAEGSGAATGG